MIYNNNNFDFLKDNRLSLQSRGLLSFVFSLHKNEQLNSLILQKLTGAKRTVIETCLNELSNLGYLKINKGRKEGKYVTNMDFFDVCQKEILHKNLEPIGFLYVVKMGNFYKIGTSKTPKTRLKEFTKLPYKLEKIICENICGYQRIEQELHAKFDSKRVRGEWFLLEEKDIEYIDTEIEYIKQNGLRG